MIWGNQNKFGKTNSIFKIKKNRSCWTETPTDRDDYENFCVVYAC